MQLGPSTQWSMAICTSVTRSWKTHDWVTAATPDTESISSRPSVHQPRSCLMHRMVNPVVHSWTNRRSPSPSSILSWAKMFTCHAMFTQTRRQKSGLKHWLYCIKKNTSLPASDFDIYKSLEGKHTNDAVHILIKLNHVSASSPATLRWNGWNYTPFSQVNEVYSVSKGMGGIGCHILHNLLILVLQSSWASNFVHKWMVHSFVKLRSSCHPKLF